MNFLWSDLHIGHENLAKKWRLWASQGDVTVHNDYIRNTWNSVVSPDDSVWVVGDACMGTLTDSLAFAASLNGT